MRIGFDRDKYLRMQSSHIAERRAQFGGKLYLEFGGKLIDDMHASRVLPGFTPDNKIVMLAELADEVEIVMAVNAKHLARNKVRADLGIPYEDDLLRHIDAFRSYGLYVGSVVVTQWTDDNRQAQDFKRKLEALGITVYRHFPIPGYPGDVARIVSAEGYGRNEYIETSRDLVVVTAPGPGSGKMATCLSQIYHDHLRGISSGYAKFETFPIWNLPLDHPVNIAYEAATADLDDVNMIDPFHLAAHGVQTVNYNRDVEVFPGPEPPVRGDPGLLALRLPHGYGRQHGRQLHQRRRGLPAGRLPGDHPSLLPGPGDREARGHRPRPVPADRAAHGQGGGEQGGPPRRAARAGGG